MAKTSEMKEGTHKRNSEPEIDLDDEPETGRCLCGKAGEINYDDGSERRFYCYSGPDCCP